MPTKLTFIDQLGRKIVLDKYPSRIISVVPSQTELLFDLGLGERVAGVTKYCCHPASALQNSAVIGATKQLDLNLIRSLKPDLIIANKEENDREQIEELMQEFPVWVSDINDLSGSLQMIQAISELTCTTQTASNLIRRIEAGFSNLTTISKPLDVLYFIWRKPYMTAGTGTFIDHLLARCGLRNALLADRYPALSAEEIVNLNPAVIFLSSEPYPFKEKHIAEFRELLPDALIEIVDGELFSWYGSRLIYSPDYFNALITNIDKRLGVKK
ncbi:helical backbone metal receptor [Mucilaginibacter sp. RS28]|uniref:Helical backbone metal receptor n=1 Tax=Mucilaginibacter straminoryzae TaxID=2932774 RepID=A0A9X1X6Z8_9SPHI|nr:helical backbone metal receptor [Mucilaginibacter straminoryzae]MCJ8209779.1 helical backbone metal receptor [Mucilaginibacter straminoryzae]